MLASPIGGRGGGGGRGPFTHPPKWPFYGGPSFCKDFGGPRCIVHWTVSESTTSDETTSTTRFFFLKSFLTFFYAAVNFLTVRDLPYGEIIKNISECGF